MFNSGVHLWSGKVEEWEVPNWQHEVVYSTNDSGTTGDGGITNNPNEA